MQFVGMLEQPMKGIRMYKYMNISTCVYKNVYINVLTVHVYYTYIHTLYVRISGRSLIYIFMYVCACMYQHNAHGYQKVQQYSLRRDGSETNGCLHISIASDELKTYSVSIINIILHVYLQEFTNSGDINRISHKMNT